MGVDGGGSELTKGKKMVGDSGFPHQLAIYELVIQVEPAKPARPRAAGGAIGWRKICIPGVWSMVLASFSACLSEESRAILMFTKEIDSLCSRRGG